MNKYVELKDKFYIMCRKCHSEDVDLGIDECGQCGDTVEAECNKCHNSFSYHKFEQKDEVIK